MNGQWVHERHGSHVPISLISFPEEFGTARRPDAVRGGVCLGWPYATNVGGPCLATQ